MRGPIDYIIVNFDEPKFEGRIIEELQKATETGAIAVLGLSLVQKQADGTVATIDVDSGGIVLTASTPSNLVDDDDIQEVGSLLEPGQAAGLLIVEQLWAKGLKLAIQETGGQLYAEGRIHPEAAREIEDL